MIKDLTLEIGRRGFLGVAGSLASLPILGLTSSQASAQTTGMDAGGLSAARANGRRMLGKLEVSSVGLGVQNMHRTYQTTIPYRPEMINIIRTALTRASHSSTAPKRMARTKTSVFSVKPSSRSETRW